MNASSLRHIIKFQTNTTTSDSMGGNTEGDWDTVKTIRATVTPIGSDINYEYGQTIGTKTFEITTRYSKDFDITRGTMILWGDRILTPNVPVNVDSLEKWMTFQATEKV